MIMTKLLKILALFFLVGFVATTPISDVADFSAAECPRVCMYTFSSCAIWVRKPDVCRDSVCAEYHDKCSACPPCTFPASYWFNAALDAPDEDVSDVVKGEPQEGEPHCMIVCDEMSCRNMCLAANAELPEDLNGALVIDEADLNNGTVAIEMVGIDQSQAGEQRHCVHWVCVFRNCYYVACHKGGQGEETAHLATLEVMAENRDNQTTPEGCQELCNDDTDMCITLCAPSGVEEHSTGLTPRIDCQSRCMGQFCFEVCYAPYLSADNVEKSEDEADLTRRNCQKVCWDGQCWAVCYPPYAADDGVEDAVEDGVAST